MDAAAQRHNRDDPGGEQGADQGPRVNARGGEERPDADPSRVRRCRRGTLEYECKLVEVTPIPVLARFVRPDNRMPGHAEVRGRVPARRVVTASDVAAFLADPQMHPVPASLGQAVLATPGRGRDIVDPVEMRASAVHVQALPSRATGGASSRVGALVIGAPFW